MLGKLIKFEFRSTARYFVPIYLAMVIVAGLAALVGALWERQSLFWFLSAAIYAMLAMALVVITVVAIISRFYKNLLGQEGYLMFTLPVSTDSNILAKLITSIAWTLGSLLLCLVTITIFNAGDRSLFLGLGDFFREGWSSVGGLLYGLLLAVLIMALCILFCYLCMAIGQLFNEHKFLASAGAFLVLQTLLQILGVMGLFGVVTLGDRLNWQLNLEVDPPLWTVNLGLVVLLLALCLAEYFITRWLLDKKLNLA